MQYSHGTDVLVPVGARSRAATSRHAPIGLCAPGLKLEDVAFGIGDVAPGDSPAVGGGQGHDVPYLSPAGGQHPALRRLHVVNGKGDVRESWSISRSRRALLGMDVLVDLQGRPVIAVPGQAQVRAPQLGPGHAGPPLQVRPSVVPFGRYDLASENCPIEVHQPAPVGGHDVDVAEADPREGQLSQSRVPYRTE